PLSSNDSGTYASKFLREQKYRCAQRSQIASILRRAFRFRTTPRFSFTRRRPESFDSISMERTQSHEPAADFSIEEYGAKTAEKEECEEQLLTEYATLLGCYLASVAMLTGIAADRDRLPRTFSALDLALLGIATHKLSRIIAKDRITSILRA